MSKQPVLTTRAQDDQAALLHARKQFPTSAVRVSCWSTAAHEALQWHVIIPWGESTGNACNTNTQQMNTVAGAQWTHYGRSRHHGQKPFSLKTFQECLRIFEKKRARRKQTSVRTLSITRSVGLLGTKPSFCWNFPPSFLPTCTPSPRWGHVNVVCSSAACPLFHAPLMFPVLAEACQLLCFCLAWNSCCA